jgi:putative spermidine/putrescine transport system ATP-binding protein
VGKAEIARRVREILELVRLEAFADRLPKQLSGGEQQRVALARAVVYSPRALLMDEPLGALDKKLRDQLQREIARMHRELGMTFVFVTHDQQEALTLSDRIAVFNDGKVEQVGAPGELYDRPQTLFVAQFLGESNIFRGNIDYAGSMVDCGGFALRAPSADRSLDRAGGVVVVRPERLQLHRDRTAIPSTHNRVDAMVTDVVYVGNHHQIGLKFGDGSRGTAMRLVGSPLPVAPGEQVTVAWDPHDQSVVADPDVPSTRAAEPVEATSA